MDFTNLFSNDSSKIIDSGIDPVKHQEIVAKLCNKRRAYEKDTATPESVTRESSAIALMELKSAMNTFGISEIDYQAFLHTQENKPSNLPPTASMDISG